MHWWQHLPEKINPVFLQLGPFELRYYSLMYLLGFGIVYYLASKKIKKLKDSIISKDLLEEYLLWMFLAVIIGGRFGYVLFYNFAGFIKDPLSLVGFSDGEFQGLAGMSFHGGVIAIIIGSTIFCRRRRLNFWKLGDFIIPYVPLAYTFGRIGNFINGELYGRVTTVSWGMYFPLDLSGRLRHPSQLYEALGEGILVFLILLYFREKRYKKQDTKKKQIANYKGNRNISMYKFLISSFQFLDSKIQNLKSKIYQTKGFLISIYLISYGAIRFFLEYFREPDEHLGFVLFELSMGQVLCLGMVLIGGLLLGGWRKYNR